MTLKFKKLFENWKSSFDFKAFISDGIVDFEKYEQPHILFILRDMNCPEERNLCADLRSFGSGAKTWSNAGRWAKALLESEKEYPYDMSPSKRAEQLSRISVINLKKEGGKSRTNGKELEKAVIAHKIFIFDEISLCEPDIIICCGLSYAGMRSVAALLYENVFCNTTEWDKFKSISLDREWWYYFTEINGKNIPVISFCHPQVTNLCGRRGHENLFKPLYQDMLYIREKFIVKK